MGVLEPWILWVWINKNKDNNSVLNSVSGILVDKVGYLVSMLYDINRELL